MRKGWIDTSLDDVCQFKGGTGFKEHLQGKKSGLYPFIKVSDMTLEGNEKFIINSNNWIDESDLKEMGVNLMPQNSVVFAKVGAALKLNKRRILTRLTAIDNNMMAAIPDIKRIDPEYLYYFMLTQDLGRFCQESAVPSVNQQHMSEILIPLPPLAEQKKIAAILRTWDDAIEKQRALIDKLRERREKILKKVFYADDWNEAPLKELAQVTTGQAAPQDAEYFNKAHGLPFLRVSHLEALIEGKSINHIEKISESSAEKLRLKKFPAGTTIFAKSGMSALLPRVYQLSQPCYLVSHLAAVIPNNDVNPDFITLWFKMNPPVNLIQGDGFPSIRTSEIAALSVKYPPIEDQNAIARLFAEITGQITLHENKLEKFKTQKRGLMQKLLTGAWPVTVSDKEAA